MEQYIVVNKRGEYANFKTRKLNDFGAFTVLCDLTVASIESFNDFCKLCHVKSTRSNKAYYQLMRKQYLTLLQFLNVEEGAVTLAQSALWGNAPNATVINYLLSHLAQFIYIGNQYE